MVLFSRACKIRFSKTTLRSMTKKLIFGDHAADPIAHASQPRASNRTV